MVVITKSFTKTSHFCQQIIKWKKPEECQTDPELGDIMEERGASTSLAIVFTREPIE